MKCLAGCAMVTLGSTKHGRKAVVHARQPGNTLASPIEDFTCRHRQNGWTLTFRDKDLPVFSLVVLAFRFGRLTDGFFSC